MDKFRVVMGFTTTKCYDVESDSELNAIDEAHELANQEENAILFDHIECVDVLARD